jgi:hypothetical protein
VTDERENGRDRERVDTSHLDGVADGCGCAEVWEHLSEGREADTGAAAHADTGGAVGSDADAGSGADDGSDADGDGARGPSGMDAGET